MPSNILHSVSAAELKAESMIKLPMRLGTRTEWKEVLSDAVNFRKHLENIARKEHQETGEYIRPIILIQAQPKYKGRESVTVERVKQTLLDDHNVPAEHIAVSTGDQKELEGIDILSNNTAIRFVITVQALKEGWDCPFAYILCSVAELSSSTAVEQILGRVLRLPNAKLKENEELNMAYVFVSSPRFFEALNALKDTLIEKHGFERLEADQLVGKIPERTLWDNNQMANNNPVTVSIPDDKINVSKIPEKISEKITINKDEGTASFKGIMTAEERRLLKNCFTTTAGKLAVEKLYYKSHEQQETGKQRKKLKHHPKKPKYSLFRFFLLNRAIF